MLPFSIAKGTDLSSLEPSDDAMVMEGVLEREITKTLQKLA